MNDRYLFRAKRIENGEWVEGYYIYYPHGYYAEGEIEHILIDTSTSVGLYKVYSVDPSTICQCTGLKDKDGKLIWENDICKVGWIDNEAQAEGISEVTWDKNGYYPWLDEYSCDGCDLFNEIMFIEVIGNIFDNPELLEQEG